MGGLGLIGGIMSLRQHSFEQHIDGRFDRGRHHERGSYCIDGDLVERLHDHRQSRLNSVVGWIAAAVVALISGFPHHCKLSRSGQTPGSADNSRGLPSMRQ